MNQKKLGAYFLRATFAILLTAARAAPPAPPPPGTASDFAVLDNTAITNTGSTVVVGGNVGSGPTGFAVSGFPPGIVTPPGTLFLAASAITNQANTDLGI